MQSQEDSIVRVTTSAAEAANRASSGLEEIIRAHRIANAARKQKRRTAMAAIAALVFVVLVLSKGMDHLYSGGYDGEDGSRSGSNSLNVSSDGPSQNGGRAYVPP